MTSLLKITVICWDADFRDSLHTIDFFANQSMSNNEYEFIWVDYYNSNNNIRNKINEYENFKLITLDNNKSETWHLGKCINAGLSIARGEIIIIPDGDIVVESNFLSHVYEEHQKLEDIVLYFKRFDETIKNNSDLGRNSIDHLKLHAKLLNPTNYAGCLTLRKKTLVSINGYETHCAFAGPGINGIETYIRLKNAGCYIKWDPDVRIFHPWHPSSGRAGHDDIERLKQAKATFPWIIPYAGLKQSWITHQREIQGDKLASESRCDQILQKIPNLESFQSRKMKKRRLSLNNLLTFIRK